MPTPTSADVLLGELLAENARLKSEAAPVPGSRATLYVGAVIGLSLLGVSAVVIVTIVRPTQDNTGLITIILGFLVPLVTALLAAAVQQVHLAVNSRLSQLLLLTKQASQAEGKLEGKLEEKQEGAAAAATIGKTTAAMPAEATAVIIPITPVEKAIVPLIAAVVWVTGDVVFPGAATAIHLLLMVTLVLVIVRLLQRPGKVW